MICQQQERVPQGTSLRTRAGQEDLQHPEDWQEGATHTMGLQLTGVHMQTRTPAHGHTQVRTGTVLVYWVPCEFTSVICVKLMV